MFTRILHVSIAVRSLEQALPFYRDVLGLRVAEEATLADQGVRAALLPMQDGEVELLQPVDPEGGVARFLARRGEGLHHLCFETPDISAALEHLRAAGLPLIDQSPRPGLAGMIAFLHPTASHGVLVELTQPLTPPPHPEPRIAGIQAVGLATVYAAVNDLGLAAATCVRNFHADVGPVRDHPHLRGRQATVSIGSSRITLLSSAERVSPVGCFLADRGEGLFGVCLRVTDLDAALRHLEAVDVPTEVHRKEASASLVRLDPALANGVNLFLCAGAPDAPPRRPAG
jgi:methylmalonyl-CoA/ethylmalonyl-CoA epimerase